MAGLTIRWTVGDVSDAGYEALSLSAWGAWRIFGSAASYVICVNSIGIEAACARTGALPVSVRWRAADPFLDPRIARFVDEAKAEGVAWKFAPVRVAPHDHELALDNDCILWSLPPGIARWLASDDAFLLAEDVIPAFGKFADLCGDLGRNTGIRGLPPREDLGARIASILNDEEVMLTSELDEQGVQVAAMSSDRVPLLVSTKEVSICSPFPPHQTQLGSCGAHFVGLNAHRVAWDLNGRPAVEYIREHWIANRNRIYELVGRGVPPEQGVEAASQRSA